jgi:hypothetical protein
MSNFDRKLRQSPNYIQPRFIEVQLSQPTSRRPRPSVEQHPLATVNPNVWAWPAERVSSLFLMLGVMADLSKEREA